MSTALYRRYRPERFADVIGQDHVTDPLRAALRSGRVHHAYLLSGPRGCGKTTSARILARTLNCHARLDAAPPDLPDEPCGTCPSCVDLALGNAGSLDVIEIDAASHNGVDDARDLRERAAFAPVRDSYKIFVIDEAHMVTSAGFNALLKIVEEPPAHIRFVFATTEPDKVIGTIRSRTHHYPFRLVGPADMTRNLEGIAAAEGKVLSPGVTGLLVRAGAGSVRDAQSVLDQLIAGADGDEVTYSQAVDLLGYTHATMIDDVVEALIAHDGAAVFAVVGRVVSSGHDPRRFVEDLLERYRDIVIAKATGEGVHAVLPDMPTDQRDRLVGQAERLGAHQASRAATVVHTTLSEMTGATSPRLHLELMMARLLLPEADDSSLGFGARLDSVERRLHHAPPASAPSDSPVPPAAGQGPQERAVPSEPVTRDRPAERRQPTAPVSAGQSGKSGSPDSANLADRANPSERASAPGEASTPGEAGTPGQASVPRSGTQASASSRPEPPQQSARTAPAATDTAAAPGSSGAPGPSPATAPQEAGRSADPASALRREWPAVLDAMRERRRTTWTALQHATVFDVSGGTLTLVFSNDGALRMFGRGDHAQLTAEVIRDFMALSVVVTARKASGDAPPAPPAPPAQPAPAPAAPTAAAPGDGTLQRGARGPAEQPAHSPDGGPTTPGGRHASAEGDRAAEASHGHQQEAGPRASAPDPSPTTGRESRPDTVDVREAAAPAGADQGRPAGDDEFGGASLDDAEADPAELVSSGLVGVQAVERILGGHVVEVRDVASGGHSA